MSRSRARGFLAVQLQNVRPQRLDDVLERRVVGIDRQRHLDGAALGLPAEFARGLEAEMPRRRRKEHEAHHVGAGLERDVERLARGQAADFDEQGHGLSGAVLSRQIRVGTELIGRVLQRRALLVSPGGPVKPRCAGAGSRGSSPPGDRRGGAQIGQFRPRLAGIGLVLARRAAPAALAEPGRRCRPPTTPRIATAMITTNSGSVTATDGSAELNGSNDTVTEMTVGDREDDEEHAKGMTTSADEEFSHDHLSHADFGPNRSGRSRTSSQNPPIVTTRIRANALLRGYAPASGEPPSRFSRSRISLPVLKNGTLF